MSAVKKALIAAANHYTSPFQVGSHHYARQLAALGYEVLFLSAPISPLHELFSNSSILAERKRIYCCGGLQDGNITYYLPWAPVTPHNAPILSSKWLFDNWYRLTSPSILNYIRKMGFMETKLVWFDTPIYGFLLDEIDYVHSVLRIADYSLGFSSVPPIQYQKEIELANEVEIVVYTAKELLTKYPSITNEKLLYLPNGVDFEFFRTADRNLPADLAPIPPPRIVYVGAIHEWFHAELLRFCALERPEYSFVLIGPIQKDFSILEDLANVYLLGKRNYTELPKYLYNCQVGIIPFNAEKYSNLVENIHPLKLYEYMACGLPVVSTSWMEIRNINSPAYLCENESEFMDALDSALEEEGQRKQEYIDFAACNSWDERLKQVLALLNEINC